MQIGEMTVKLKIDAEVIGDPAALKYMNAISERRFRYVALFGTWVTVLIVAWLAMGCNRNTRHVTEWPQPKAFGRSDAEKSAAAVHIDTTCTKRDAAGHETAGARMSGSGVIAADDVVWTAYHVVDCAGAEIRIDIETAAGVRLRAELAAPYAGHDLARLRVPGARASRVSIRPPHAEDFVCAATASPDRRLRCGELLEIREYKTSSNGTVNLWHEIETEKGNSGSGVYDSHGYLIGVLTNLRHCEGETVLELCGLGTSIAGRTP